MAVTEMGHVTHDMCIDMHKNKRRQIMIEKRDISITVYGTLDLFIPVISITIMEAFEHIFWLMLTPR